MTAAARTWDEVKADPDGCIAWGICPPRIVRAEPRAMIGHRQLAAWIVYGRQGSRTVPAEQHPSFEASLPDGSLTRPIVGATLRIGRVAEPVTYHIVGKDHYSGGEARWLLEWPD